MTNEEKLWAYQDQAETFMTAAVQALSDANATIDQYNSYRAETGQPPVPKPAIGPGRPLPVPKPGAP